MMKHNDIDYQIIGDNCKIIDSYKTKDKAIMIEFCKYVLSVEPFNQRSIDSYIAEWRAHNLLYNLGLFKKSTKDADLNVGESKIRRFFYSILSIFYR